MSDVGIVFLILGVAIGLFAWDRLPVELVAIGVALALAGTGVLSTGQALAGFGDPTIIFIATLFVVSTALEISGVTAWAGQQLLRLAGDDRRRLLVFMMLLCALLTAIISPNGAVAALIPMVVVVALKVNTPTSQLMMPLAFAAHAGSMLTLTGTPVNVLVSEAATEVGGPPFRFFEFALVGVPLLLVVIGFTLLFGRRLLPNRTPTALPPDLSGHARTLRDSYLRSHKVYRLRIPTGSELAGASAEALIEQLPSDLELVTVLDERLRLTGEARTVRPGDVILVRGSEEDIREVAATTGVEVVTGPFQPPPEGDLVGVRVGVAELVLPPRSAMVGTTAFPGMVTDSGDLVILAIQRGGEDLGPLPTELAVGDVLLVQGDWRDLEREVAADPEVLAVDPPTMVRSQTVPLGPGSGRAIAVTAGMVVLLATGVVTAAVAGLLAASAMVLLGVLTPKQAYGGISWTTVLLVGGMIPLSTAMEVSGAADRAAGLLVDYAGNGSPRLLLVGIFVLAAIGGAALSNTATALIMIPIALAAAAELGVSARPTLMAVTVASSAAFLLPITTPANLMVMGPGGYKFHDYWRFGLPILGLYGLVVVYLIPLIWPF